jgi:hypothetical protein
MKTLHFREKGWGGYSYITEADDGRRFFLKLQPVTGPEWASAPSSPRFYLPLLHQLHVQNLIRVPSLVLTTDGGFSAVVDGYELVLYDYIDGEVVGFGRLPEPVLARLAEMVGILHRSTQRLRFHHPFSETYGLGVEPVLRQALAQLARPQSPASQGVEQLRATIARIRAPLLDHLARFKTLQANAKALDKPQVICHTDLHGGNLMVDQNGDLVLLDWESAMLAPPEHDLFFIAGEQEFRDVFLPHYESEAGPIELDPDLFGFYFYRRAFEDVAGFITRILAEEGDPMRDADDLAGIQANLEWMDSMEAIVAQIANPPTTT